MKKFSTYLAGLLLLAGCASDPGLEETAVAPDDPQFWLTVSLARPEKDPTRADADLPAKSSRAEAQELDKTDQEAAITSLLAVLADNEGSDKGRIKGMAKAENIYASADNKSFTAKVNMGLASLYLRQHEYALYIFANLSDQEVSDLSDSFFGKPIATLGQHTADIPVIIPGNGSDPLKLRMASGQEDVEKVRLEDDENDLSAGTISLTPLHARLDFISHTSLTFPISFNYEDEKGASKSHSGLEVEFKSAKICNASPKAYLLPQEGTDGFLWTSPAISSPLSSSDIEIRANEPQTLGYVAENIPGEAATFSNSTYIELKGILKAGASASETIKATLSDTSHPDLYYYDDGTFQSDLTKTLPDQMTNWHKIEWDSDLGGYAVTYRHAVRHDAGEGKNADDGTIYPMEYAVVRNHLYYIGINSVRSLPHKFDPSDPVESGLQEITLQISPAKWLQYHRGGVEIEL